MGKAMFIDENEFTINIDDFNSSQGMFQCPCTVLFNEFILWFSFVFI